MAERKARKTVSSGALTFIFSGRGAFLEVLRRFRQPEDTSLPCFIQQPQQGINRRGCQRERQCDLIAMLHCGQFAASRFDLPA